MLPETFPKWAIFFTSQLCAYAAIALHIIVIYVLIPSLGRSLETQSGINVILMTIEILGLFWFVHSKILINDFRKARAAKTEQS